MDEAQRAQRLDQGEAPGIEAAQRLVAFEEHLPLPLPLLVPPGDAPGLARAMIILARDAQLRARYSAAARHRVLEFTTDRMVERTLEVYRSIEEPSRADSHGEPG